MRSLHRKKYVSDFEEGDLVEYMRENQPRRPRFGIVLGVKKIIGAYQLRVLFGINEVFIDSRYVEKRCK